MVVLAVAAAKLNIQEPTICMGRFWDRKELYKIAASFVANKPQGL